MPSNYLILGASSGIGMHVAEKLLSAHHQVISLSRNAPSIAHPNLLHHFFDTANIQDDFLNDWEINFLGATRAVKFYLP